MLKGLKLVTKDWLHVSLGLVSVGRGEGGKLL